MINKIKGILKPLYQRYINLLTRDLKIKEHEGLLHHIIEQNLKLVQKQELIQNQLTALNTFVTGLEVASNPVYQDQNTLIKSFRGLVKIFQGSEKSLLSPIMFFDYIGKLDFKDKVVCLLGDNPLYVQQLYKFGAKKVIRVSTQPTFIKKDYLHKERQDTIYVFPTDLDKLNIDPFDILLVPDKNYSAFLINNNLQKLGSKIREYAVLSLRVQPNSVLDNKIKPKIFSAISSEYNVFNDNYIRQQLHANGFTEVSCLYTHGNYIDSRFDQKITHFFYKNGYKIIKRNQKPKRARPNTTGYDIKLYLASTLPSKKNILTGK